MFQTNRKLYLKILLFCIVIGLIFYFTLGYKWTCLVFAIYLFFINLHWNIAQSKWQCFICKMLWKCFHIPYKQYCAGCIVDETGCDGIETD